MIKHAIRTASALGLLLASTLILAQQPTEPQPAPAYPPVNHDLSADQLNSFADAYVEIMEIQQTYGAQLEGTEPPDEAQRIQEEANQKMLTAIEEQGLDLQEYTLIVNAVDSDPELREQVIGMITERQ